MSGSGEYRAVSLGEHLKAVLGKNADSNIWHSHEAASHPCDEY